MKREKSHSNLVNYVKLMMILRTRKGNKWLLFAYASDQIKHFGQKTNKKHPFGASLGRPDLFPEAYEQLWGDPSKSPWGSYIYPLAISKW